MKDFGDGSVISSYFNVSEMNTGSMLRKQGTFFVEGQVQRIHFTDEETNRSKTRVEYDVIISKINGTVSTIKNAPYLGDIQSTNDFKETILESNEFAFRGDLNKSNFSSNMNGTKVIVGFLDGDLHRPVIFAGLPHPRVEGAKKADGIRMKREFRGISTEINKDGEWEFIYKSPLTPDGKRVREDTTPTRMKIDVDGNFLFEQATSDGTVINSLFYDRKNEKMIENVGGNNAAVDTEIDGLTQTVTRKFTKGMTFVDNGESDSSTKTFANGMVVEESGDSDSVTITTAGGLVVKIDGSADKMSAETSGGSTLEVDGSGDTVLLKDNGTGSLKITGNTVALGAAGTEVLLELTLLMQELITLFGVVANHNHLAGNLGYPTSPPDPQFTQAWILAQTQITAIQAKIQAITGSL